MNKFAIMLSIIALSSCSVYKAASDEGVRLGKVRKCTARGCFLSLGMDLVTTQENESNGKIVETYRGKAAKSGANYLRAAGHGVLDVITLGVWEVAGTPVEGAISNNPGFITVKATYANKSTDHPEKIEIYDASGAKVQ